MNTQTTTIFSSAIRTIRESRTIEITKSFDKASSRFGTEAYEALQQVRQAYPDYRIVVKATRTKVDHFKGLTYDFMERYIASHDNDGKNMEMFNDLRATSEEAVNLGVDAASYGEIKAWFFRTYPEIEAFQKRREAALAA